MDTFLLHPVRVLQLMLLVMGFLVIDYQFLHLFYDILVLFKNYDKPGENHLIVRICSCHELMVKYVDSC